MQKDAKGMSRVSWVTLTAKALYEGKLSVAICGRITSFRQLLPRNGSAQLLSTVSQVDVFCRQWTWKSDGESTSSWWTFLGYGSYFENRIQQSLCFAFLGSWPRRVCRMEDLAFPSVAISGATAGGVVMAVGTAVGTQAIQTWSARWNGLGPPTSGKWLMVHHGTQPCSCSRQQPETRQGWVNFVAWPMF